MFLSAPFSRQSMTKSPEPDYSSQPRGLLEGRRLSPPTQVTFYTGWTGK